MNTLKIFSNERYPEEKVVYLKLRRSGENIIVVACDERGQDANCGNLIKIFPDSTFARLGASEMGGKTFRRRK